MFIFSLCIVMNYPILFDTISLGWFIVDIKGSQVGISKLKCASSSFPEDCYIGLDKQKFSA